MTRVLLADVGHLDFSKVIPALAERDGGQVVTLTLDVGQHGGTASSRARALAAGAVRAHVLDMRDEFARAYLVPMLRAGALRADDLSAPRALLRTLTADRLVEVAAMEGTTRLAHGWAPGTPEAGQLAQAVGRHAAFEVMAIGSAHGPEAGTTEARRRRCVESTLWWRRFVAGPDGTPPPAGMAGAEPGAVIDVTFAAGVPVALNGIEMPLVELIEAADTIAGDHGVGLRIVSPVAQGFSPAIEIETLEAPAAAVLIAAHAAMTRATASPLLRRLRRQIAVRYAAVLDAGEWASDARAALDGFVAEAQKRASGTVRLTLRRGKCRVTGSPLTRVDAPDPRPGDESAAAARSGATVDLSVSH